MAEFITGTEFDVRFDMIKVSFSKVTNIGSSIEYDTFIEGGRNDSPIVRLKPKTRPDTIIFERGVPVGSSLLKSFLLKIQEGKKIKNVMIFVKHNGKTKRILCFDSGIIVSRQISEMDAMGESVMIEKLEIAHNGLKEMPVSF